MSQPTPISPQIFWPYCAGVTIIVIATIRLARDLPLLRNWQRLFALGPLCFGIPMAVFGAEHLSSSGQIMRLIPEWIPGPLFWTYLVGLCLIAAALSMVFSIELRLSSLLLGAMLFLFVLLIHIPNVIAHPGDRLFWIVAARDLAFACGAVTLGMTESESSVSRERVLVMMRLLIAAIAVFFGIENLLHTECVPAVPLQRLMPAWIPLARLWTLLAGVGLILGGTAMFAARTRELAARALGVLVLLLVLLIYVPMMIAKPDLESLNYVTDTLVFAGTFLVLAIDAKRYTGRPRAEASRASAEQELSLPKSAYVPRRNIHREC